MQCAQEAALVEALSQGTQWVRRRAPLWHVAVQESPDRTADRRQRCRLICPRCRSLCRWWPKLRARAGRTP